MLNHVLKNEPSMVAECFGTIPNRKLSINELAVLYEATLKKKIKFLD
jgi:hypothetical protein